MCTVTLYGTYSDGIKYTGFSNSKNHQESLHQNFAEMPDLWPQYLRLKKTLREKSVYLWIFVHLQKLKNPIRVG